MKKRWGKPADMIKPRYNPIPDRTFDGHTVYQDDYIKKNLNKTPRSRYQRNKNDARDILP